VFCYGEIVEITNEELEQDEELKSAIQATEEDPSYGHAWEILGDMVSQREEIDEAVTYYENALELGLSGPWRTGWVREQLEECRESANEAVQQQEQYEIAEWQKSLAIQQQRLLEECAEECVEQRVEDVLSKLAVLSELEGVLSERAKAAAAPGCGALAKADGAKLSCCSGCRDELGRLLLERCHRFCSAECQVADWKAGHSKSCPNNET